MLIRQEKKKNVGFPVTEAKKIRVGRSGFFFNIELQM